MATQRTIPLDETLGRHYCVSYINDVLKRKYGCSIDIIGRESAMGQDFRHSRNPPVTPEKRSSYKLKTSVVSVWKADLTHFEADAIVNAANDRLQHFGGLALALSEAGGPSIQSDSDRHMKNKGPLSPGDTVIGDAGTLKCQRLIHAVGPHLSCRPSESEVERATPLLERAIWNILEEVHRKGFKSVAIPALSSGLFHFPVNICANIIVAVLSKFDEKKLKRTHPIEIFLVNNDESTVKEIERACLSAFGGKTKQVSQPARSKTNVSGAQTSDSSLTVKMKNVRLTLRKGLIQDQKMQVIVNTIGENLSLSDGQISQAILKKAGRKMQEEIDQKYKAKWSPTRPVLETEPHGLDCKQVYHAVCVGAHDNGASQILFDRILQCITMASDQGYRSIAFPAIGTGVLGFNKNQVASIMTQAVEQMDQSLTGTMDVHLVIYPQENHTFTAFEAAVRVLQQRSPPASAEGASRGSEEQNTSVEPGLSSPSAEANEEATQWLQALLQCEGSATVNNNFIQYLGEKELQLLKSDAELTSVELVESFERGCAQIKVQGDSARDVVVCVLKVEALLCDVQKDFVRKEEARRPSSAGSPLEEIELMMLDKDIKSEFQKQGRYIQRVWRFANPALKEAFERKEKQLGPAAHRRMFQRIPAQFCCMLNDVGFQREFAPPVDAAYGAGIYFAGSVAGAVDLWGAQHCQDVFEYYVEARVLTGRPTRGSRHMIMPPAIDGDPLTRYHSLTGGADTAVVFNGHQALPRFMFICRVDPCS